MLGKVRPYLRSLFAATAECAAGAAAGGALVAGAPLVALSLVGFAAALLIGKAWFETYDSAAQAEATNELSSPLQKSLDRLS